MPIKFEATADHSPKLRNLINRHDGDQSRIYPELVNNYNEMLADARAADGLNPDGSPRRGQVRNENTFSSTFTTSFLIMAATTEASPKFAPLGMFSRLYDVDPLKPLASGIYQYNTTVQDGSTTLTNATNFESGDSTLTPVTVTVAQYTEPFHVTNAQLNSGLRMSNLVTAKIHSLGSKIVKALCANITAANFTTLSPIIRGFTTFGVSDMSTAWAALQKASRKNIMLNGQYLANITNTPLFLQVLPVVPGAGWKNVIGWDYVALNTEWSAAGNNINGFACGPDAIGTVLGLPLVDAPNIPGGILREQAGVMPGIDCPVAAYAWFNTSTRTYWASFDIMFGSTALDTTIGLPIAIGTPS